MQNGFPYEIVEKLVGGPRPLYKVRDREGRILAVKTLPTAGLTAELRQRFEREAEVCRHFDHPNLLRILDSGEAEGMLYHVMELLQGEDLCRVIDSRRALPWDEKLGIMSQVCDALEHAHGKGILHRDIKPANIFVEASGRVRVLDFGMARTGSSQLTQAGISLGTLTYMSPEQVKGEECVPASDVFAAGMVFYELATGRHPYAGPKSTIPDILHAILLQPLPPFTEPAPMGLENVLRRATEKELAVRLPSAAELKRAITLCRTVTEALPPTPAEEDIGKTRVMSRATAGDDPGATRVIARPGTAPQPDDPGKTRVIPMPMGVEGNQTRVLPSVKVPVRPADGPAPPPETQRNPVYCPSCTSPNPPGTPYCKGCGLPLASAPGPPAGPTGESSTVVYLLGALVVALALVLVYVLSGR